MITTDSRKDILDWNNESFCYSISGVIVGSYSKSRLKNLLFNYYRVKDCTEYGAYKIKDEVYFCIVWPLFT